MEELLADNIYVCIHMRESMGDKKVQYVGGNRWWVVSG